jgi:hypothetical protein
VGVEAWRRPAAQARRRCQNAAPPRASLSAPEAGPTPATASYASALTTNRLDAALFTNQARCLVSEPEARTAARRPAMGVHVSMEQRAEARLRPRLPAPAADDGRGGGARCGAASGGCGARREEEEPAGVHAHDEQARARVKCTEPACVYGSRRVYGAGVCARAGAGVCVRGGAGVCKNIDQETGQHITPYCLYISNLLATSPTSCVAPSGSSRHFPAKQSQHSAGALKYRLILLLFQHLR